MAEHVSAGRVGSPHALHNDAGDDAGSGPVAELTHLGKQSQQAIERPEVVPWHDGPLVITLHCTEFSSLCPVTHQPDFGTITIIYTPSDCILETKSLKLYLWKFREYGAFNERICAQIARELREVLQPLHLSVTAAFNTRGGIGVTAHASTHIGDQV